MDLCELENAPEMQSVPRFCISNLTIPADLHRILVPEESLHLKNHRPCCQNTLSKHYKTLQLCYTLKYLEILYVKGQENLQNATVKYLIINTEVNIDFNS